MISKDHQEENKPTKISAVTLNYFEKIDESTYKMQINGENFSHVNVNDIKLSIKSN